MATKIFDQARPLENTQALLSTQSNLSFITENGILASFSARLM